MAAQNGATVSALQLPFVGFQPGLPASLLQIIFSAPGSEQSANFKGSPHYNDQLIYRADGSDVHLHGMDYAVDNVPEVTFGRYETSDRGVRRNVAETTWRSADGHHTIRLVHKALVDPHVVPAQKACCEGCYNNVPLCFSHHMCPGCFVTKSDGIQYSTMAPETCEVYHDGHLVGKMEVKPVLTRDSGTEPHLIKQSMVYDAENNLLWVMNDGEQLTDTTATRNFQEHHCCAGSCQGQCDALTPLCCPACLPLGAACCRPGGGGSSGCIGGSLACCLACCCTCLQDGADANRCCGCCACLLACIAMSCERSASPGSRRPPPVVTSTTGWHRSMPVDSAQKVRRILYPLQRGNGNGHGQSEPPAGWVAYTFAGVDGMSSCASFTRPEGPADEKDLLMLPLLIDLSMGTEQKGRETWSFYGSQRFPPVEVVNYWPKPQVLNSVVVNMNQHTFHNVTYGEDAPMQQSMGPGPIAAKVIGADAEATKPTEVEPEIVGATDC